MSPEIVSMSNVNWDALYKGQSGGSELNYYKGVRHLRGNGLGSVLMSVIPGLVRFIPQFLGSTIGKEVINSGVSIAADVADGVSLKKAAVKAGRKSLKKLTGVGKKRILSGVGKRKPGRARESITIEAVNEPKKSKNLVGIIKPSHSVSNVGPGRRLKLSL